MVSLGITNKNKHDNNGNFNLTSKDGESTKNIGNDNRLMFICDIFWKQQWDVQGLNIVELDLGEIS